MNGAKLRIGDYVMWHNRVVQVTSILSKSLICVDKCLAFTKDVHPIKITNELLDRNFEYDSHAACYKLLDDTLEISTTEHNTYLVMIPIDHLTEQHSPVCRVVLNDVEYVHELQHIVNDLYNTDLYI